MFLSSLNMIWISHFPFKPQFTCKKPESMTLASEHWRFYYRLKTMNTLEPPTQITAKAAYTGVAGPPSLPCRAAPGRSAPGGRAPGSGAFICSSVCRGHRRLRAMLPTTVSPLPAARAHGNHSSPRRPCRGQQGPAGQAGSLISSRSASAPLAGAHCRRAGPRM